MTIIKEAVGARARAGLAINIAVIALCALFVGNRLIQRVWIVDDRPDILKHGSKLSGLESLGFDRSSQTLILITASTCHFCQSSLGFYRRLTQRIRAGHTRFVSLSAEPESINTEFLRSNGVYVEAPGGPTNSALPQVGTPTLVLVDRRGYVIDAWSGALAGC